MTRFVLALALSLSTAVAARGQLVIAPNAAYGARPIVFTNVALARYYACGPFGCRPFGVTTGFSSTTVYLPPPPIVYVPPPRFDQPVPPPDEEDEDLGDWVLKIVPGGRPPRLPPPPDEPAAPPGEPAGEFRPVDPADRDKMRPPPLKPEPLPPPPADETVLMAGKRAFAAQKYGRAAELFRRAVESAPVDAEARLLLAQAYFALGKYPEATAAAHAGVRLRPDWPRQEFHARNLTPKRPAEFDEQLTRLADALKRTPDDPALQFLYGYQLWFDDHRAEAEIYLRRARRRAVDPEVIDRFLVLINDGVLVRGVRR